MTRGPTSEPGLLAPENAVKLLGVIPLFQISKIYGISYDLLASKREELGVRPVMRMPGPISKELIPRLGWEIDEALALRFFVPVALVKRIREALGINMFKMTQPAKDRILTEVRESMYWATRDRFFGKETDADIARILGVTTERVMRRRVKLGIEPILQLNNYIKSTWSAEEIKQLGTMSDRNLAKHFDTIPEIITRERIRLGIPAYEPPPFDNRLLGTMPDRKLAELLGWSPSEVAKLRHEFKIESFTSQHRHYEDLIVALNAPREARKSGGHFGLRELNQRSK